MNTKPFQISPYLRVQRKFPPDEKQLSEQVDQAYIDIAAKVNLRTVGVFGLNFFVETGESWYLTGEPKRQQTLRQVYLYSDASLVGLTITIPHGLDLNTIDYFTKIDGNFFDGTFWQTLPYVDVLSATNQINVKISTSSIIITKGAGAPPAIVKGEIVLEWLSQY